MTTKATHKQKIGKTTDTNSIGVYVAREVTLTEDLSTIVWRRLEGIDLVVRDGFTAAQTLRMTRGQAKRLAEALNNALTETEQDSEALQDLASIIANSGAA